MKLDKPPPYEAFVFVDKDFIELTLMYCFAGFYMI